MNTPRLWSPDRYAHAVRFAAIAHLGQKMPGSELPYLTHIVAVAAELMTAIAREPVDDPDLAVTCALLHDTIEDTGMTEAGVEAEFGPAVAAGVLALSKDPALPKALAMADSLRRIQQQPREVWLVKLSDRIVNLERPPHYWSGPKIAAYRVEAVAIAEALGSASPVLHARLRAKIAEYQQFIPASERPGGDDRHHTPSG